MQQETITLAPFEARHLDGALALSRADGWAHRRDDWQMIWSLSEGIVALLGDRVVGTAFMTPFDDACSAINMIIVDENQRGRGLGRQLTTAVMALAGERECRLTATSDGLPLYEKLGFVATHQIVRHQGVVLHVDAPEHIEWVGPEAIPIIKALDRLAFGAGRKALCDALSAEGRVAVVRKDGDVVGFAATRLFGKGEVVGPVVAASFEDARNLIAFILADKKGSFVRIDIPEETGLAPTLEKRGLPAEGGVTAMVRGAKEPQLSSSVQTFCLASQAIG